MAKLHELKKGIAKQQEQREDEAKCGWHFWVDLARIDERRRRQSDGGGGERGEAPQGHVAEIADRRRDHMEPRRGGRGRNPGSRHDVMPVRGRD